MSACSSCCIRSCRSSPRKFGIGRTSATDTLTICVWRLGQSARPTTRASWPTSTWPKRWSPRIRNIRNDNGIPNKEKLELKVQPGDGYPAHLEPWIAHLTNLSSIEHVTDKVKGAFEFVQGTHRFSVPFGEGFDIDAERAKVQRTSITARLLAQRSWQTLQREVCEWGAGAGGRERAQERRTPWPRLRCSRRSSRTSAEGKTASNRANTTPCWGVVSACLDSSKKTLWRSFEGACGPVGPRPQNEHGGPCQVRRVGGAGC